MVKYIARKRDKINTSLMLGIHNKKRVVIIFSSTGKKLYNHFHHLLVLTMKVDRSILFINLRNYLFTVFFFISYTVGIYSLSANIRKKFDQMFQIWSFNANVKRLKVTFDPALLLVKLICKSMETSVFR